MPTLPPLRQTEAAFPPGEGPRTTAPYLEQGLAAEVYQEESLLSLLPLALGLLEELTGQQHRVLQDLTLLPL